MDLLVIYPYLSTTSNIVSSCRDVYNYCWRNGLKIKTSRGDLTLKNLNFMTWLGFPKEELLEQAAYNGDLELLIAVIGDRPYMPTVVAESAARGGKLHILKWLDTPGYNWPHAIYVCAEAAKGGHQKTVEWLFDKGCTYNAAEMASEYGHLELLKWMLSITPNPFIPNYQLIAKHAARGGQLHILKWLEAQNKLIVNEDWCSEAAAHGHIEVLNWTREIGAPWTEWTAAYAAARDQLEVLKWLKLNGAPFGFPVCANLAYNGNLKGLKWARENGVPWDEQTCSSAVNQFHLDVLKWVRENGCPWDDSIRQAALKIGYLEN